VQLSKKQLERQFSLAVGTTPKVFCRVSRFLDVCHRLREYQQRTLTELTHECGYFDQSHFIKDFKQFSGFTPKQFSDRNNVSFADI
jgi:AraC-like DNA-binding protein